MELKKIVKGTTNRILQKVNLLGKDTKELGINRLSICQSCDIYDEKRNICSSEKGGCGCYMKSKVLVPNAACPLNKW